MKLASRGQRDMDTGPEPIDDPEQLSQIRRQAWMVYAKAVVFAVVLTALAWFA